MVDSLEGFDAFVAVVETGGFAAAARRLRMTTSAVSKQVGKLEARMQARLLLRTTRRLSVTEAGEVFLEHARRALAEAEAAREAVADLRAMPRGVLRITTPMSFGILHIAPSVAPFLAQHPEVRIDMVLDDRVQDLVAGGFDLAIRLGALGNATTAVARRLGSTTAVLCASTSYLARRGEPRIPSDLAAHDTLLYSYYSEGRAWSFEGPKGPVTVALEPRYRSNNALALREVALGGGGILRVPTFIVGDDLATSRLERVLPRWRLPAIDVHAVFPARAYVPLKARAFLEFLLGHLKEQKFWT